MSLTFDELSKALGARDASAVVGLLEPCVKNGSATMQEALLCGVTLLLPPFADYETSASIFRNLMSRGDVDAAMWDAYRYAVLMPDGDRPFQDILEANKSSVTVYLLGLVLRADGDFEGAIEKNRQSLLLGRFPFNLLEALKFDSKLGEKQRARMWREFSSLVKNRSIETAVPAISVKAALDDYFNNLITGDFVTSELWSIYEKNIEKALALDKK